MKAALIQESFLSGEISERAQGHVNSDIYKAGLHAARNMVITQLGSVSSRAGGQLATDGVQSSAFGAAVATFDLEGSPWGDVTAAVSGTTLRFYNRWGPVAVSGWQDLGDFFAANAGNSGGFWTDPARREVLLAAQGAGSLQIAVNAAALNSGTVNLKGELHFYFSGSGFKVQFYKNGVVQSEVTPSSGYNKLEFIIANVDAILLTTLTNPAGATAWGFGLVGKDRNTALVVYDTLVTGMTVSPGLRHAAFWDIVHGDYYIVFVGPGMLPLRVKAAAVPGGSGLAYALTASVDFLWGYFNSGLTGGGFAAKTTTPPWLKIGGVVSILAYQSRLWFGLNDRYGTVIATRIGYRDDAIFNSTLGVTAVPGDRFVVSGGHTATIPVTAGLTSTVLQMGVAGEGSSKDVFTIVTATKVLTRGDATALGDFQIVAPAGGIYGTDPSLATINFTNPLAAGDILINRASAQATDALDLSIAQPTGPVCWMNELRGMLLGTTVGEHNFSPGALAIDAVNGSSFDVVKHSAHGSDIAVDARAVLDKVLFVSRGRQRIRMMGENIITNGGLVSPDISALGADLLKKWIRCMVVLRSPVTRLVLGFDDGTGAIALVNEETKALAWSRFSLPAPYDIYSLAAVGTAFGTELWVGTSKGALLVFANVDSDPAPRVQKVQDSVSAAAPAVNSAVVEPTLPAMDGWLRLPTSDALTYGGLPVEWVGRPVWILVNGVVASGAPLTAALVATRAQVTLPAALPQTWVDASGVTQQVVITAGIMYPEHGFTTLSQEGGNPQGTAQGSKSRAPQLYLRFVDSFIPLIGGTRGVPERDGADAVDLQASRITGDARATQLGFDRARKLVVEMDLPLRFEVSAIFGGTAVNST